MVSSRLPPTSACASRSLPAAADARCSASEERRERRLYCGEKPRQNRGGVRIVDAPLFQQGGRSMPYRISRLGHVEVQSRNMAKTSGLFRTFGDAALALVYRGNVLG